MTREETIKLAQYLRDEESWQLAPIPYHTLNE